MSRRFKRIRNKICGVIFGVTAANFIFGEIKLEDPITTTISAAVIIYFGSLLYPKLKQRKLI